MVLDLCMMTKHSLTLPHLKTAAVLEFLAAPYSLPKQRYQWGFIFSESRCILFQRTGEEVAVKVFTPQSYQRPRQVQIREFEVMKRLNHENVVRLLAIEEEGIPADEKDLKKIIRILFKNFAIWGTVT